MMSTITDPVNHFTASSANNHNTPFNEANIHWPHILKIELVGLPVSVAILIKEAVTAGADGHWTTMLGRIEYVFEYMACKFSIQLISRWIDNDVKWCVSRITLDEWCV